MAAIKLIPLLPKQAGFFKDGSLYQGEYCTNGQWVRFYQGKPKKIGGMVAIQSFNAAGGISTVPQGATHITVVWLGESIVHIVITPIAIYCNYANPLTPYVFTRAWAQELVFNSDQTNMLWQSKIVTAVSETSSAKETYVVLFGSKNLQNINDSTEAVIYKVAFTAERISSITEIAKPLPSSVSGISGAAQDLFVDNIKRANGGIVYVDNFLFFYGKEGTVVWSDQQDPFSFSGKSHGSLGISYDKVIYGAGVRGGNNPPTVLFWTMNSVVRMSNQTGVNDVTPVPSFQIDIVSRESSILSSRSVVEYDGVFYWLGTDRFFLYMGLVREVVNNINYNWFFDNLDMSRRQLVFGVKNSEKGEIWWYFPVKGIAGGCSAALIYNMRENSWYNTNIFRDCGYFDAIIGKMVTYGESLDTNDGDTGSYIWVHEEGYNQKNDDGTSVSILSSYTTPVLSLTSFSPFSEGTGNNNQIYIDRIEPDFNLEVGETMSMQVNSTEYPDQPFQPIFASPITITGGGGKVDIGCQGRNINFTFKSENKFQHGCPLLGIKVGDGRG